MSYNKETGKIQKIDNNGGASKEEPIKYENANTIFEICKSEYESERTRTNTIDSKISIITAIVTALIVAILSVMDSKTCHLYMVNARNIVCFCALLIISYGPLFFSCISLFILLFAIMTRKYETIDQFTYLQVEELNLEKSIYYLVCACKYADCCKKNREINEKRCNKYNISVFILVISMILLLLYIIFMK